MEKLGSIIAPYVNANALQGIINQTTPLLTIGWYNKRFVWGPQRNNLTFSTVIGQNRIASLASVIDRDSSTPPRSRPGLQKILGEIPAIKHYTFLKEEDARLLLEMQDLNALNGGRLSAVLDLVFNDVKYIVDGISNRIDDFVAQALSTGQVLINTTNNPDGIVQGGFIDMFLPSTNKLVSGADWGVIGTDIIADIVAATQGAKRRGTTFDVMLIDTVRFYQVMKNTSVMNFVSGFYNPGSNKTYAVTLGSINEALAANLLPTFELVDFIQMVEIDGVQNSYSPWTSTNVSFVPAGNLGVIHNARAIEDGLHPAANCTYAKSGQTLISKWSTNEPFREYTKGELNAFPGVEQINSVYIMRTDATSWS